MKRLIVISAYNWRKLVSRRLVCQLGMKKSEEFLDLLAQHESQIMALLWAISPGSDVAEDLFQQTVLTMWQKLTPSNRERIFWPGRARSRGSSA